MVHITLLGNQVQAILVLLPGRRVFRCVGLADRLFANQNDRTRFQVNRIQTGIVLHDGFDRDRIALRNSIKSFALLHRVLIEGLLQLFRRKLLLYDDTRFHDRDFKALVGFEPLSELRIFGGDHLFRHSIGFGQRIERFPVPDVVDIVFCTVDINDRLRFLDRLRLLGIKVRPGRQQHRGTTQFLQHSLLFLVFLPAADFGNNFLGIEREIAVHHPGLIARLDA